ncbi:MAG: DNA damage-inducible protein D [Candidatus Peregrinibacteria bacterium]|nr:DNA damage-inducible protein D [Candidatus Peregrinibacteria bacterium]
MHPTQIQSLTTDFESYSKTTDDGVEFWLARDLQKLLEYTEWRNFLQVIEKAKISAEATENKASDHFVDVNKMVELGSGSQREIEDIMLTRYACYLIAQNGDSKKESIAFAQNYFAIQTRKFEIIQKRLEDFERINARKKLTQTEKELSKVIFEQTGNDRNFALIRSKGDTALFGRTTKQMKEKWEISAKRPLADFAPTIVLKAKDFATEITIHNAKTQQMGTEKQISKEHVTNNKAVRNTLLDRGIVPEELPPSEDIKKVKRKLSSDEKKNLKNPKKL